MIPERYHGLPVKAFRFGRWRLGLLYSQARQRLEYWDFRLTEGRRLRKLKNIHAGERCFIIGNGPSIRQHDLAKLRNEIVFVVNDFFMHEDYSKINPNYHCLCDVNFYRNGALDTYRCQMLTDRTRDAVKFMSVYLKPIVEGSKLFLNHSIYYLYHRGRKVWELDRINMDITKELYIGDTLVVDYCLPLAFYMGCSTVYLIGCDCDYQVDKAADFSKGYFYDTRLVSNEGRQSVDYLTHKWFDHVTRSHSIAKQCFEAEGRAIYNAGIGGTLEVYERVNYDNLF